MKLGIRKIAAAGIVAAALVVGTAIPASAVYDNCLSGYACFYRYIDGDGTHFSFSGNNPDWTPYGVVGEDNSAKDNGTSTLYLNVYTYNGYPDYCMTRLHTIGDTGAQGGSNFWSTQTNGLKCNQYG
ncbi:hypothetical protein Pth03_44500 [Planotetraspora thailandica]|uniref:Peptidase inhibitor family I36 n=1 Tax=Planotetraspora thailandica TaxID=487172 RepID=A0A8J3XXK6_9ACTN|nr:peptidase inhibitor family I36 protein [Planotetraspora thailandica]GII56061.1 hypothetical protein Pth03_44500 [Planotetraspora thailandica]